MSNHRELLARGIAQRFITAISGTDKQQLVFYNPEDRIFVGKLSPQNTADSFSSRVLIKQLGVDFRIPKQDVDQARLAISPQGNFFFRVLPTLQQQQEFFLRNFCTAFDLQQTYPGFSDLAQAYLDGRLSQEMARHKVQLLPIYEKIAIDQDNTCFELALSDVYCPEFDCGSLPQNHPLYQSIEEHLDRMYTAVREHPRMVRCQFRELVGIGELLGEEEWEAYIARQIQREEFDMSPRFAYSLAVDVRGNGDSLLVTVSLSNETPFEDESVGAVQSVKKNNRYRIPVLFNSGLRVRCVNTSLVPIELEYFSDDYKYDKRVYALGNNCNVDCDPDRQEIQTTHVPVFIQNRLKTNDKLAVPFDALISDPVGTLERIHQGMLAELEKWKEDYDERACDLTEAGREQFAEEINGFDLEIRRFKTGVDLIRNYNMIRDAFRYMNMAFKRSAKGYSSWRLFQIVFVVSLILDVAAHEPELMLDEGLVNKAKTDDIDILYFPTGGGKTEAFLGIMVFNLFFDRMRDKQYGVTAILKYPLRLLSVQQVQRVSNILACAELLRREQKLGGASFSLGYFVGEGNTPNKIDREEQKRLAGMTDDERDEKHRLLDVCPFCGGKDVHVVYEPSSNSLQHVCRNQDCPSQGPLPLYMVDDDIYRYLPSVIISTVDKMSAIGFNSRFHNLLAGAEFECPHHGFTDKTQCLVPGCQCTPFDFRRVSMKDPAPTLLVQDELHLIRESLGTYDAHYETFLEYFIKHLSGCRRGLKVIGATATISAYELQAKHLYWKNAIRFPAASPYLDHNFYAKVDPNDVSRIILGYAPFGKAIVNSVAFSLQYLKRVVWQLYQHPEEVLSWEGMDLPGDEAQQIAQVKQLLEDYWIILEYNNVKLESKRVLQGLEDPINTELREEGIPPLRARKMTGDDTFQEVRATLSAIENAKSVIQELDFNMIAATSMISHGVDADRFNLMLFYGMPGNTAEYIQAYSRVGRKHTGLVIDIMRPSREKDQSYLRNFNKFHEFKDILVDPVSINRWAAKAVESTLPGIVSGLLLNYYLYQLKYTPSMGNIGRVEELKAALLSGTITAEALKDHARQIYKCSDDDTSIGSLYRRTVDRMIDELVQKLTAGDFKPNTYLTQAFEECQFHVMRSLRDTDRQVTVELR